MSVQVSAQACLRVIMQSTTVTAEPAGRAARSDHRRGRRSVRQDRSYPARPVEQSRRRAPGAARSRRVPRKEHEQCIGRHHPAAPAAGCVLCGGLQSTKVRAMSSERVIDGVRRCRPAVAPTLCPAASGDSWHMDPGADGQGEAAAATVAAGGILP